jgi:hypothetical protein
MKGGSENGVIPDTFRVSRSQIFGDIVELPSFFQQIGHYSFDTAAVIAKDTFQGKRWSLKWKLHTMQPKLL